MTHFNEVCIDLTKYFKDPLPEYSKRSAIAKEKKLKHLTIPLACKNFGNVINICNISKRISSISVRLYQSHNDCGCFIMYDIAY